MVYKKFEFTKKDYIDPIEAELAIEAEKIRDEVVGYCEHCGEILTPKVGKILKYDEGSTQFLLCPACYEGMTEKELSYI